MNLAPLDSSRQAASFQPKIFAKIRKNIFFCEFSQDFWLKRSCFDERNPTVLKFIARKSLNNGAMAV
jgi:hypothetical protein